MKNEAKKLLKEKLKPENIKINLIENKLIFSNEIENKIEDIWKQKESEIKKNGGNFYNGNSYRMLGWKYKNNILELDFAIFDFKHRFGATQIIKKNIFDTSKVWHGGCHAGATVKTNDNKYLMVKISGKSINSNIYDFAGGIVEDDIEFIPNGEFIFKTIKKELKEEAGIDESDIENICMEMLFQGKGAHTGFYFSIDLNISSKELLNRFKDNKDQDIESLKFFTEEEYKNILKNHNINKKLIYKEFFENI